MNFNEALDVMNQWGKVRQGKYIYFLGKQNKSEPYTLIKNRIPIIKKGFLMIDENKLFIKIKSI